MFSKFFIKTSSFQTGCGSFILSPTTARMMSKFSEHTPICDGGTPVVMELARIVGEMVPTEGWKVFSNEG